MTMLAALTLLTSTVLAPAVLASQASSVAAACAAGARADTEAYLGLVTVVVQSYLDVRSHQQLLARCPSLSFRDVTNDPAYVRMQQADPLPLGFEEHVYEFVLLEGERGVVDVVFKASELVNVRAQLFFAGADAVDRARAFALRRLQPLLQSLFGQATREASGSPLYVAGGIAAVAGYVPGTTSVSVWLMDERYL